jgi:hypothetical protein
MELQVMMQSLHNAALHRGRIRHLREVYSVRVSTAGTIRDQVELEV